MLSAQTGAVQTPGGLLFGAVELDGVAAEVRHPGKGMVERWNNLAFYGITWYIWIINRKGVRWR